MPSLMSPDEWSARTIVTVKAPRSVVPPVFIGLNFSSPLAASHSGKNGNCTPSATKSAA